MSSDNPLDLIKGTGLPDFGQRVGSVMHKAEDRNTAPGYQGGLVEDRLAKAGSGEGSRGGHIVGHTSAGKPVYAKKGSSFTAHHAGTSGKEHREHAKRESKRAAAMDTERKHMKRGSSKMRAHDAKIATHKMLANAHHAQADKKLGEYESLAPRIGVESESEPDHDEHSNRLAAGATERQQAHEKHSEQASAPDPFKQKMKEAMSMEAARAGAMTQMAGGSAYSQRGAAMRGMMSTKKSDQDPLDLVKSEDYELMGWADDLQKAATVVGRVGLSALNDWAESREADDRMRDFDDRINKAANRAKAQGKDGTHALRPGPDGEPAREPKSIHFNPFDLVAAMGYRERPTALTYASMEMIGRGVPVIADIVSTRTKQVTMFCDLPEDRYSPGFRVRRKDWRKRTPLAKDRKEAERLEDILLHTGHYDAERPADCVMLRDFVAMFIPDSLTFDQACFEVVPNRKGLPAYITMADSSTFRLIDQGSRKRGDPFSVQVVNGAIVESFLPDELAFCVRNPRSAINAHGYGTSEIETLVREITGFLWGMDYNRRFFSQGSATKGVLNFKGTIPDKHLQAFRRQWYSMVSGVSNAWKTPITNADELQWINMQMSNRDMEYSAWMDFLIKICCARYNIATEEVNFSYGNTGQSQAMGTAPIEDKLKASKDLGLRPLVRWTFQCLNQHFIQRLNPDFEAIPVGLDETGIEAETELLAKQTKIYMTVNEARAQVEMDPLPDEQGEVILDPTWLQYVQGKEAMAQEDEGDFGDEGGGPDEGYDDDSGFAVTDDGAPAPFDIGDAEA